MSDSLFSFDRGQGARHVCGADEAGRACWAGPLVAAAVRFNCERLDPDAVARLADHLLGLVEATRPVHHDETQSVAVPIFRDERQRRGDLASGKAAELFRRLTDEFIEHAKHGGGVVQVVEDRAGEDLIRLSIDNPSARPR